MRRRRLALSLTGALLLVGLGALGFWQTGSTYALLAALFVSALVAMGLFWPGWSQWGRLGLAGGGAPSACTACGARIPPLDARCPACGRGPRS